MGKSRVLLIFPTPISAAPTGLAYIASMFRKNDHEVKILVNTFKKLYRIEDITEFARAYAPDVIGVSFCTFRVLSVYDLIQRLGQLGATTIAGGPHPTLVPAEALEHGFDIVVRGEGEYTVDELSKHFHSADAYPLKNIRGISYRDGCGRITHNPNRDPIEKLDEVPLPALELFDTEAFVQDDGTLKGFNRVFVGRGCPSQCTFCETSIFGKRYRSRSVESVIDEIEGLIKDYNIREFSFGDDTFTIDRRFVFAFCDQIRNRRLNIRWSANCRVKTVTPELLKAMKQAGCFLITLGVESGDPTTLRMIKKGQTVEEIREAISTAYNEGLKIYACIMTGFPWETAANVSNTIDLINEIKDMVYSFSVYGALIPYPSTAIFNEYKAECSLENFWLREKYQDAGMVIYQNVDNPYQVSSFYQRNLFDDVYVAEDYFFKFSAEYKEKVKQMLFAIGKHNLRAMYYSRVRRGCVYLLGRLSKSLYDIDPMIERKVVGRLCRDPHRVHKHRRIVYFVKR